MDDSSPQNPIDAPDARRVLLIDADDGGRDMTRGLLKLALQGRIEIAETGDIDEAVGMFASGATFDCVLLDCDLPGVDVPDALRRIGGACGGEEAELPCPVVVLNGSDGAARAEAVFGAGAQDRIAKQWLSPPFLRRVLENAIERFAMQRRARGQAAELAEAAERLRASERQRTLALEAADMGTFEAALPGGELTWDRRCRELFGLEDRADVTMAEGIANIHPEDRPRVERAIAAALDPAVAAAYDVEYRVAPPDRPVAWVRAVGRVTFRDDPDAPEGRAAERFVGVLTNVTDRVQAERQRELALESAQMGTWELDPAADTVAWDERCRAMFGMSDRPVTSIGEALLGVHAEDRDRVRAAIYDAMDPATGGGVRRRLPRRAARRPAALGCGRPGSACSGRTPPAGRTPERFYGVITDVTDRVEAERQRRVALDSAQMGTWDLDLAAGVVRARRPRADLAEPATRGPGRGGVRAAPPRRPRVGRGRHRGGDRTRTPAPGNYDLEYRVVVDGNADNADHEPDVRWVRAVGRAVFRTRRRPPRARAAARGGDGRHAAAAGRRRAAAQRGPAAAGAEGGPHRDLRVGHRLEHEPVVAGARGALRPAAGRLRRQLRGLGPPASTPRTSPTPRPASGRPWPTGSSRPSGGRSSPTGTCAGLRPAGRCSWTAAASRRGMIGVNVDVTDRKLAEEAAREREAFNAALMEGSPDCVKVLDLDGRVLHMNGPGVEMMGYRSIGEVVGRAYADCYEGEHRTHVERCIARAAAGKTAGGRGARHDGQGGHAVVGRDRQPRPRRGGGQSRGCCASRAT